MQITIIAVGKVKEQFFRAAIDEYSKRLSRYCKLKIIELPDEKTPDNASPKEEEAILLKEGNRILDAVNDDSYVFALAIEGGKCDSVEFAGKLNSLAVGGKSNITFIIGGSLGLHPEVKKRADNLFSFSDMTFPHQLMRVILLEQIYRAYRIINNEPYHK